MNANQVNAREFLGSDIISLVKDVDCIRRASYQRLSDAETREIAEKVIKHLENNPTTVRHLLGDS